MKIIHNHNEISRYITTCDSIIDGLRPTLKAFDGSVPIVKAYRRNEEKIEFLDLLTKEAAPEQHLDILSSAFTLTFSLGKQSVEIDRFVFLGYYNQELATDYTVREFKIYFSDKIEDLFNDQNLYYAYKNDKDFEGDAADRTGKRVDIMLEFPKTVKARFFGFKVSEPNRADDITRIGHMGLYSNSYSDTYSFLQKYFGNNALTPEKIKICGGYEGFKPSLCDGFAFDGEGIAVTDAEIIIKERAALDCTHVYVAANEKDAILINGEAPVAIDAPRGEYLYYCENDCSKRIVIKPTKPTKITEIGLNCGVRRFEVTNRVINENFYGIGTNTIPYLFAHPGLIHGMNEALWEEEKRRTMLSPPAVVRLWFQPDWFIIDKESYYNHVYNFDSDEMQSVYKYLDMYKAAGSEIEFNFGWKVADRIWDWYCIKGVDKPRNSAPADLDEFAYSCAAVLKELIENRGYTNIKYLTFYNEPNWGFPDEGDFVVSPPVDRSKLPADYKNQPKVDYWIDMLRKAKAQLIKVGLDYIEMWGPESSCGDSAKLYWAEEFLKVDDILDVHTTHRYSLSDDEVEMFCGFMKEAITKPLVITEFNTFISWKNWQRNVIEMIIEYARNGASGALHWVQSGTYVPGFDDFVLTGPECCWDAICLTPDRVNQYFYNLCLFMRYVPSHSKVLYSAAYSSDTRITAFLTPKGDTVIAVEAKGIKSRRTLNIALPDSTERTFHRFTVLEEMDLSKHPHLPYCETTIKTNGNLVDTLAEGYTLTVYTTEKPQQQITCHKGYVELSGGESHEITYTLHDTNAKDVKISVAVGAELVTLNGSTVTANKGISGTAAIRVELTDADMPCYDIVLIKI